MRRIAFAAIGLLLPFLFTATPANAQAAAGRHYDCSKAGNANKAACKTTAAAAIAPVGATKPATRNYDCTKAGNANKAACKAAAAAAPASNPTTRNYDCSKAGNANKAACKNVATKATPTPAARPAPTARPTSTATAAQHAPVVGQNTNAGGPNGATAKCKDGTMSFSAHRSGTCSRHGGVAQFY